MINTLLPQLLSFILLIGGFTFEPPLQTAFIPGPLGKPAHVAMVDTISLPDVALKEPAQELTATLYAYSSTLGQTNGNPFVTASGVRVNAKTVANNCLPFGTRLEINGQDYIVQDRMNARYGCASFDVWHPTTADAIAFGKQTKVVTVY